jgi:protein gp37
MGEDSKIGWTTHTLNFWVGCTKVGPGCEHCYAEAWDARFDKSHAAPHWGPGAPRRRTSTAVWAKAAKWDRDAALSASPTWVFVQSLSDILDNEVDDGLRYDAWDVIRKCRNLRFQILTKRIGNASKMLPLDWRRNFTHCGIMATVVTQEECDRDLPKLLAVKRGFGVSWVGLSIEPQIESVFPRGDGIPGNPPAGLDWVITGGESAQRGQQARPYSAYWALDLINRGKADGYAVYVKQMGSNPLHLPERLHDRAGANPDEWPEVLRVRGFPRLPLRAVS